MKVTSTISTSQQMEGLRCVQINLHHCKAAMDLLARQLKLNKFDIVLMQEPYLFKGAIKGLGGTGGIIYYNCSNKDMRTCIYVRNGLNAMPINNLCSRDLTTIRVLTGGGNAKKATIVASAYLPYEDKEPPATIIRDLVDHGMRDNLDLILGCDANAHHTVWGSSNVNRRGEALMDFVVSSSLQLINRGNKPTFVEARRAEVIDITLASNGASRKIYDWHVSEEITGSDHRYICFRYSPTTTPTAAVLRRNPRNTNWSLFQEDLKMELGRPKGKLNSIIDIEFETDKIVQAVSSAWTDNCREKKTLTKKVPWWNSELVRLRKQTRKAFNTAKVTKDFTQYSRALTKYNSEVRKAKRKAWRTHCEEINSIPEGMRLSKIMSATMTNPLSTIKDNAGKSTETGKETLTVMFNTHFPGCKLIKDHKEDPVSREEQTARTTKADWDAAKEVVDERRVRWALNSFSPYKSPGPDGIYPILLQKGATILIPHLCRIFKACIAYGHIPKIWRQVKVIYIPKPGKDNYDEAKAFRPISLSSFFLKSLEKLVDKHIREGPLKKKPLHGLQCAYQPGKSTETALHHVVTRIEEALENKQICVGAFIDIEGAFDRTTFESIKKAATTHGIKPTICKWIEGMLKGRIIQSKLLGDEIWATTTRGCPQGGVLSPILWCLVVDSLITKLNKGPYFTVGYADDLVILTNGLFPSTASELIQGALKVVEGWCNSNHLSINPSKTTVVPFTRKRDLSKLKTLTLYDTQLKWCTEAKYLGMTLDKELSWNIHVKNTTAKALRVFAMCRSTYGKTWGLKPRVIYWIYTMMIRPILTYGSIVWWPRSKLGICKRELLKVQRIACVAATGAFPTTPTAAMELILGLVPLHIVIQVEASKALHRLSINGVWSNSKPPTRHTRTETEDSLARLMNMGCDKILPMHIFKRNYSVHVPTRDEWSRGMKTPNKDCLVWYTDGSKMKTGSGAGIYTKDCSISESLGQYATVFQAETYAICTCAQVNIDRDTTSKTIYILSDSQAALKALDSCRVDSGLVLNCMKTLNRLGRKNRVVLIWVPGHVGVRGNEMADELARKGSERTMCGPEPCMGLSIGTIKNAIRESANERHISEWMSLDGLRHSKKFINNITTGWRKKTLGLARGGLRLLTGALTGHFATNVQLTRMNLAIDPTCRACGDSDESMEHLLCECDALARRRMSVLGRAYPEPEDFRLFSISSIIAFMRFVFED